MTINMPLFLIHDKHTKCEDQNWPTCTLDMTVKVNTPFVGRLLLNVMYIVAGARRTVQMNASHKHVASSTCTAHGEPDIWSW